VTQLGGGATYHVKAYVVRRATKFAVIRVCVRGRRSFVTSYPSEIAALKVAGFLTRLEKVGENNG